MAGLVDLPLKRAYHKPEDDIARAFYLPVGLAKPESLCRQRWQDAPDLFSGAIGRRP